MKIIIVLVITSLFAICPTLGQKDKIESQLLLIQTSDDYVRPCLEVVTACVKDTMKIGVTIILRFEQNFSDSVRITIPKEIYVSGFGKLHKPRINEQPISREELVFEEFDEEAFQQTTDSTLVLKQESPQDKCIREALDAQFNIWLKEQPYSDMYDIERFYGYSAFALSFPVFLIPQNVN